MHISKLVQEIEEIKFLPVDIQPEIEQIKTENRSFFELTNLTASRTQSKISSAQTQSTSSAKLRIKAKISQKQIPIDYPTYSLVEFLSKISEMRMKSSELLDYFFIYVKYVLRHTREKLFNKLRFYEKLINTEPNRF